MLGYSRKTGILSYFDAIVDAMMLQKTRRGFLIAAKQLGITPENAIVFEDSVAGVQAANIAQMMSIGIGDEKTCTRLNIYLKILLKLKIVSLKK
jgi:beta-phosphoglucomutase